VVDRKGQATKEKIRKKVKTAEAAKPAHSITTTQVDKSRTARTSSTRLKSLTQEIGPYRRLNPTSRTYY